MLYQFSKKQLEIYLVKVTEWTMIIIYQSKWMSIQQSKFFDSIQRGFSLLFLNKGFFDLLMSRQSLY